MKTLSSTSARIDLDNLRFNFRSARQFIGPNVKYMAVVKADAYGHGAVPCSRALADEGVDWLCVARIEEAVELREAGIKTPLLCLGRFWQGQESLLIEREITPVIFTSDQAMLLNNAAASQQKPFAAHVKIDTGMGRVGIRDEVLDEFVATLTHLKNLKIDGLMTHFAVADDLEQTEFTRNQIKRFYSAVNRFRLAGFDPRYLDLANSPGAVAHRESRGNMVRLGGILYGLGRDVLPQSIANPELRPVMSLSTRIAQIKHVSAGESLGYGRTFTTRRDSLIATISAGYADGLRRDLSNRGRVIVRGRFAPIVGRVSMDWTIIDVTEIEGAAIGDEVVLIGNSGDLSITAEDVAQQIGTISYEVTCGITRRVPRLYSPSSVA